MIALPNRNALPVIDVEPLVNPAASERDRTRCAGEIREVCQRNGFFYVSGHGIAEQRRVELFDAARAFFDLPLANKEALSLRRSAQFRGYTAMLGEITDGRRDWHECIDIQPLLSRLADTEQGGNGHVLDDPEQWPSGLPEFRHAVMDTWDDRVALARSLVEGFALSLGLPASFFDRYHGLALCDLRLSHYPAIDRLPDDTAALGMNAHVDLGFLAILDQDTVGGLEVYQDGTWHQAPPLPGAYLINIGLMMQRWTNDCYQATRHRVQLPTGASRYSAPFFYEPRPDAVVEPLAKCCAPDNAPRYPPCTVGEYFERAFTNAYRSPEA